MRSRAIREGSVGLLILLAVGLFGGLVLWLRGLSPGGRSYRAIVLFDNTLGMQQGAVVRYRGVPVGRVLTIQPTANEVEVTLEITQTDLRIPKEAQVVANQSGLIGETTIDITPLRSLTEQDLAFDPTATDCNSVVIICHGDRLPGLVGASYESLIRSAESLANTFADPELIADLKVTLKNATVLTENTTLLTTELIGLSQQLRTDLGPLMVSANRATDNIGNAAAQFEITGAEVNSLILSNRSTLVSTLGQLNRSSAQLETVMATLTPAVQDSQFLANLDILSADAVAAIADLRAITGTVNSPENLLLLQQTLESARNVFQSAQKVLADVDELTGDPIIRRNIRDLINGLSNLVSLTHQLEQDSQLAQALTAPGGSPVERVTLTAIAEEDQAQAMAQSALVVNHRGQLYHLQAHPSPVP
jgi:phospholipid/cholesterol/gamma-HCH transport system substrate-binding protein